VAESWLDTTDEAFSEGAAFAAVVPETLVVERDLGEDETSPPPEESGEVRLDCTVLPPPDVAGDDVERAAIVVGCVEVVGVVVVGVVWVGEAWKVR